MSKEIQKYKNDELGISYDPNICTHSANCVNKLPEIFNIDKTPWVNLDNATKEKLAQSVKNCPSGALQVISENTETESAEIVEIKLSSNGPLLVNGNFKIVNHDGQILETKSKAALCRCGASNNKPFCDGTHNKIDFKN